MCFQPATDCEWLLLLYLQDCLINLINQPVFAQHSGDAKPSGCCCLLLLLPSPLFLASVGWSQARRNCRKAAWAGAATSPTPARFGSEDRNKYCSNLTKPLLPSCPLPARGRMESGDQDPLLHSMPEPGERSLLPGPAATVRHTVLNGARWRRRHSRLPGRVQGPRAWWRLAGAVSPPLAEISSELGPASRSSRSRPGSPVPARPRGAGDGRSTCPVPGSTAGRASSAPAAPHRATPLYPRPSRGAAPARLPHTQQANGPGPPPAGLCVRAGVRGLHRDGGAPRTAAGSEQKPRPQPSPVTPGAAPQPARFPPTPIFSPLSGRRGGLRAGGVARRGQSERRTPKVSFYGEAAAAPAQYKSARGRRAAAAASSPCPHCARAPLPPPPHACPGSDRANSPKVSAGTATAGDRTATVLMRILMSRCYREYRCDGGCWDAARPLCAGGVSAP